MSTEELVEVKSKTEFDEGGYELVEVNGTEVGVVLFDGEFYALQNFCLHDGGPVCTGRTDKRLVGEFKGPGERVERQYSEDEPIISCPWHGWSYDLKTGEHLADSDLMLPTYEVVIKDDTVYVGNRVN